MSDEELEVIEQTSASLEQETKIFSKEDIEETIKDELFERVKHTLKNSIARLFGDKNQPENGIPTDEVNP